METSKQMIKAITKTGKMGFRFLLSLSLVFVPNYGYSNNVSSHIDQHQVDQHQAKYQTAQGELPTEFQKASQILEEMGKALTENSLKQYIDSNWELKERFDVLSLSHQRVEVLDYWGRPVSAIHFDNENNGFHSYKRVLQNIEVEFNAQEKLVFKGVVVSENANYQVEKKIGLIHIFDDIEKRDVVDWVYDKEFLVLLHRKKGLILYHTMFAYTLLGSAPIPSIRIPVPNLLSLQNVRLEFIDRTVAPPSEGLIKVTANVDGKPMFIAGDVLVSYENAAGRKTTALVLSRSRDLIQTAFKMYMILGSLVDIGNLSNGKASFKRTYLENFLTELNQSILSATLNRKPVSFFNQFSDLINIMPFFLAYTHISKNPDSFLHTEWLADFQKIKEAAPHLFNTRSNTEGITISSEQIAEALRPMVAAKKEEQQNRFQDWFRHVQEEYPFVQSLYENKVFLVTGLVAGFLAIFQSSYTPLTGESTHNVANTVYDIAFLGVGFLLIMIALGKLSIPFLRSVGKLPLPGEVKLTIEQIVEKWSKDNIENQDKLTAFGFKVAALLLPLFYRGFQIVGQENAFSALVRGINPFQRVTPNSPLGRAAEIERSMSLGFGFPRWNGKAYEKKSQLINLADEQKNRIDRLSRIIAYYAVSGFAFDIRVLLTGPLALDNNLDYSDKTLMQNVNWVSKRLSKHISGSQKIDTTRPIIEWDISVINNDFYQRALKLGEEARSVPAAKKQISEWGKATSQYLRQGLDWNTEYARVLMSYYPKKVVSNQFWTELVIDHITLVTLPLTSLTPRGDAYSGNLAGVGVEPHTLFRSSSPHMHETGSNLVVHNVASARKELQHLVLKKEERLRWLYQEKLNLGDLYKPILDYQEPTENVFGFWQYLGDMFKYPFQWGQKIYENTEQQERIDAGWQLWKMIRITMRFWAVTIPLGIASRTFFTPEYSFFTDVLGMLYFAASGFILYGLPQIWVSLHNIIVDKKTKETQKIIDGIKWTAEKIEKRLYKKKEDLISDYRTALENFKKLYHFSRKSRAVISLDHVDPSIKEFVLQPDFDSRRLQEIIQSQSEEVKGEQVRIISSLLKTRHLPTKTNDTAFQVAMFIALGLLSNIFFVYVSEKSFDRQLSSVDLLYWLTIMVGGGYAYNFLTSEKISNRVNTIRNRAMDIRNRTKTIKDNTKKFCRSIF